ncbi:hypothetical protein EMCRGX_G005141 [Ephydatia muelleri]
MVEPMDMGHSADSSELIPQIQTGCIAAGTGRLGDYAAVTRCLRAQYAPEGNHLEWQAKFQRRGQKADENLVTYVGELRVLADKAYPGGSNDQRLQLVRDQFVQGLRSSTVQLRLMKEMPDTLDEALKLAIQQESVEAAQKRLSMTGVQQYRGCGSRKRNCNNVVQQLRKQAQDSERIVQDLRKQIQELNGRLSGKEKPTVADQPPQSSAFSRQQGSAAITCWNCREQGHIRRNCPHKRSGRKKAPWQISAVSSTLMVEGSIEGRVTRMLVDTGSAVTLVREDVVRDVKFGNSLKLEVPANSVVAANGKKLDISGQCTMSIKVGALSQQHLVLVARNLNQECLLGADFLIKRGCIVDLQQHVLLTQEGPVQFVSGPERSVTKCKSLHEQLQCSPGGTSVAVYGPAWSHGGAHSIIDAAATHTMVQVLNPGFAPVTVYKDEIMGMLKPIQDPADCASVQYPVCKQSTRSVQHSIQQMTDSLAPDVREKVADLLWQFQDVIALMTVTWVVPD